MIDMNEINKEIKKIEECDNMNWSLCEKLATLYIIKDHYYTKDSHESLPPISPAQIGIK